MSKLFFVFCFIIIHSVICLESELQLEPKFEKQLESYTKCNNDRECKENSICIGNTIENPGFCTCVKDYIIQKNRTDYICLKEATNINDPCTLDIQCQVTFSPNAMCFQEKCVCRSRTHFYDNRCWPTLKLGEICTYQQSCLLKNNTLAGCVDGRCSCGSLKHPVSEPDGESCEDNILLGEPCQRDSQCIVDNSRCINICRCKLGYRTNYDETLCLKDADNLGDYCQIDNQCENFGNAVCSRDNKCACDKDYHSYKNRCYKNVHLNSSCTTTPECVLTAEFENLVKCTNICTCTIRFSDDGSRCVGNHATVLSISFMNLILSLIVLIRI